MIEFQESVVRRLGPILAVWMLSLGAAMPFLDHELFRSEIAVEAEHRAACNLTSHDHTVCTQFGQQKWVSAASQAVQILPSLPVVTEETRLVPARSLRVLPTRPRAPPSH